MSICAIVPQKPLALAKSRLGRVLPPRTRASLSLELLKRVCTGLRASHAVDDIIVMTPDPEIRTFATACGVRVVADPSPDLNEALVEVVRALPSHAYGVVVISADLPLLQPADVVAVVAAGGRRTLVIAPSADEMGTNALLLSPPAVCRPAFGRGSLAAHRDRAQALGLRVVELRRPGLAFDLDTPADLTTLCGPLRRSVP